MKQTRKKVTADTTFRRYTNAYDPEAIFTQIDPEQFVSTLWGELLDLLVPSKTTYRKLRPDSVSFEDWKDIIDYGLLPFDVFRDDTSLVKNDNNNIWKIYLDDNGVRVYIGSVFLKYGTYGGWVVGMLDIEDRQWFSIAIGNYDVEENRVPKVHYSKRR